MRNAVLFGIVAVAGCGADVEGACNNYLDSVLACVEEAYADDQATLDATAATFDGYCDTYAGLKDKESADLLNCYADAINGGDCSTPEGYTAAYAATADCG